MKKIIIYLVTSFLGVIFFLFKTQPDIEKAPLIILCMFISLFFFIGALVSLVYFFLKPHSSNNLRRLFIKSHIIALGPLLLILVSSTGQRSFVDVVLLVLIPIAFIWYLDRTQIK